MFIKQITNLIFVFYFLFYFSNYKSLSKSINNKEIFNTEFKNDSNDREVLITLDEIKDILIENNEELKVIKSQIKQSNNILNSKKSSWSPRLTLNSNELPNYTIGNTTNKFSSDTSSNQLKVGINANLEWDIINPSRKVDINIVKEKIDNLELLYKSTLNDLYLNSIENYYLIKASQQEIKVAKQAIKISSISLQESENKYQAGIGNKLDVLEAKAQLKRNQINLLERRNQLTENINSLSEILNLNSKISINDEDISINKIWDISEKETLNAAFQNRLDLEIKRKNINLNSKEAQSIIAKKKPLFTLYNNYAVSSASGEIGVQSPNYNNLIRSNSNSLGIKFNWNLFDGGGIKQNYLSLKNKNQELNSDLNLKKNQIKKEIKNAFNEYKTSIEKIILSLKQLEASEESLNISLKRLEAGITTQREIVNMQGDLIDAETKFINSIKNYKIILAKLSRMTLLDAELICPKKETTTNLNNLKFIEYLLENNLTPKCKKQN